MRRPRKAAVRPNVPCQYDCGRMATGTLSVSFTDWDESDPNYYRRGFSASIPSCRQCMKKACTLQFIIPKVQDG